MKPQIFLLSDIFNLWYGS